MKTNDLNKLDTAEKALKNAMNALRELAATDDAVLEELTSIWLKDQSDMYYALQRMNSRVKLYAQDDA